MKKIFFETLKHKLGHYLLVIFCGILMVSTIYVSYAFSDSIEGIINGQNSGIVEEMYTFINFQETYILLFILMVLVIISYIRKKSYDYVLLDTMGLKKKHRYMFIGFEYAGIIFSSVTGGLILGKILAECAKTVLQNIFYNTITTEINYGFVALRNTLVISCEVFGILFIVFDEVIACLGMDALLTVGKKNGKPLKKRPKILLLGIFLTLIGLISLLFYWGKISKSIPTVFLNAGMCLLMISLAGYYFVRLNKKEKKYYKRLTWLENWYHRFFYNINMSFPSLDPVEDSGCLNIPANLLKFCRDIHQDPEMPFSAHPPYSAIPCAQAQCSRQYTKSYPDGTYSVFLSYDSQLHLQSPDSQHDNFWQPERRPVSHGGDLDSSSLLQICSGDICHRDGSWFLKECIWRNHAGVQQAMPSQYLRHGT